MVKQDRLKQLELLGGLGGAVLGGGVALLFADWLRPYALPAVAIGVTAHGWAMFQKHRIERAGGDVKPPAWETAAYWACWLLIGALALYIGLGVL
jgi:hypothetical protein